MSYFPSLPSVSCYLKEREGKSLLNWKGVCQRFFSPTAWESMGYFLHASGVRQLFKWSSIIQAWAPSIVGTHLPPRGNIQIGNLIYLFIDLFLLKFTLPYAQPRTILCYKSRHYILRSKELHIWLSQNTLPKAALLKVSIMNAKEFESHYNGCDYFTLIIVINVINDCDKTMFIWKHNFKTQRRGDVFACSGSSSRPPVTSPVVGACHQAIVFARVKVGACWKDAFSVCWTTETWFNLNGRDKHR